MATHPEFRGCGIGGGLLHYGEQIIQLQLKTDLIWCNARTGAVEFYRQQNWRVVSEEFMITGVGPHYRMVKDMTLKKMET